VAQPARDFDVHKNVLRKWVRKATTNPQEALPGKAVINPEQAEIDRLSEKVAAPVRPCTVNH
jgi:transposase